MTRRLSAVLVADVVGFSARMERDDVGTLSRLRALRSEIVDPAIASAEGRIVKTTGDGVLAEFGSADGSLRCAVTIQRALAARNASLPADDRLELRIGINLGDVIAEDDDIFGDGVNVAARLEALAPAGGICVSEAVRDQVHGTLDVDFVDAGEQRVKNIGRPIRTYTIALAQRAPARSRDEQRARTMSIGVVPFTTSDDSPTARRQAQSLARDFAAMLARCGTLITVISMEVDANRSVRYVAHGELRGSSGSTSVHVRLLDDASGQQLWSESCPVHAETDPTGTSRALHAVAWRLSRALLTLEIRRIAAEPEGQSEPLDNVVRAMSLDRIELDMPERLRRKAELLEDALRRDPTLVAAINGLVVVTDQRLTHDLDADREALVSRMNALTARAVNLNDVQPAVWSLRSSALMCAGQMHAALQACEKAIALEPFGTDLMVHRALLLAMSGRPREAFAVVEQVRAIDPSSTDAGMSIECIAHVLLANYATAAVAGEKVLGATRGNDLDGNLWVAAAYAQAGDLRKVPPLREMVMRELPGFTIGLHRARSRSLEPAYLELADAHFYAGLRKAGFPES